MSRSEVTKSIFIPPPTDGLNLISSAAQIKITEARILNNYIVVDSGIRQINEPRINYTVTTAIRMMFTYSGSAMLYSENNKIFRLDSQVGVSATDVTGAAVITSDVWYPNYFNKHVFLWNGVDTPLTHDLGVGNVAAFSATGPTVTTLTQATGYKNRLYIVQKDTTVVWYGAVGAISGTFTSLDLAQVFQNPGNLLCAFSWTYNQGLQNEELMVFLSDTGEILVYSGDSPASANWGLIVRAIIPTPLGRQPFAKVAGDVYVNTKRGLVPFSAVVTGAYKEDPYYSLSRNVKSGLVVSDSQFAVDRNNPFLYMLANDDFNSLYILNYERGAWSKIDLSTISPTITTITAIAIFQESLMIGTNVPNLYNMKTSTDGAANSPITYTWATPFFSFGTNAQKNSKMIRVLGINVENSTNFTNTVSISTEFVDPTTPTTDTKVTAVAGDTTTSQELVPPGSGRWLSYVFSRAGITPEQNEIQGFEAYYEEGGFY